MHEAASRNAPVGAGSRVYDDPDSAELLPGKPDWGHLAQMALVGSFVILLFAALNQASVIFAPVALAFVVGIILGPLAMRATELRIPAVVAAVGLCLLVVGVFYAIIAILWAPIVGWISRAPEFGHSIEEKLRALTQHFSLWPGIRTAILPPEGGSRIDIASLLKSAVIVGTPALGQIVIFFATLFFFLLARPQLRSRFISVFRYRESRLRAIRIVNEIEHDLANYLALVTIINAFVGVAAGLVAYVSGLPDPLAWGVVGFLLNFIPYVGALVVQLALFATGVVTFATLSHALLAPLLYLAVTTFEGQFVTPHLIGRRFPLNSLTVFLSLVFWTWMWGPIGTFLAAPFAITAFAVFEHLADREEPDLPD